MNCKQCNNYGNLCLGDYLLSNDIPDCVIAPEEQHVHFESETYKD